MEDLNYVIFERFFILVDVIEVFIFCIFFDVFNEVFGICVYIRWWIGSNKYDIRFIVVKLRVVLLKLLIIFCLEL